MYDGKDNYFANKKLITGYETCLLKENTGGRKNIYIPDTPQNIETKNNEIIWIFYTFFPKEHDIKTQLGHLLLFSVTGCFQTTHIKSASQKLLVQIAGYSLNRGYTSTNMSTLIGLQIKFE